MSILTVGGIFTYKNKYDVVITGGSYYGASGGVSNFWYWREILPDGTLGEQKHGYDNKGEFTETDNKYEVKYIKQVP